jgi:hypothetical protein
MICIYALSLAYQIRNPKINNKKNQAHLTLIVQANQKKKKKSRENRVFKDGTLATPNYIFVFL